MDTKLLQTIICLTMAATYIFEAYIDTKQEERFARISRAMIWVLLGAVIYG